MNLKEDEFKIDRKTIKNQIWVFREILYYNGQKESIALVAGDVEAQEGERQSRNRFAARARRD